MTRPSPEDLLAETARLAYHLHWPLDTILDLEHQDRRRFLSEVDRLAVRDRSHEVDRPAEAHGPVRGEG